MAHGGRRGVTTQGLSTLGGGQSMDGERQRSKFAGRRAGTPNKYTSTMKEAVQTAYQGMGGHKAFTEWAKENQTEFYRIASRLIPVEVHGTSDKTINVYVNRSGAP